ncbi:MAG: B12-binding domain-containing radical SAM protein [bacterium]|nr:B12-binding domain-containing radical SAM protein [bacterium]
MKILFILPKDNLYKFNGAIGRSVNYAPITFTTLAALVPGDIDCEITIVDEGVEDYNYDSHTFDIVGFTSVVSSAPRSYELAQYWKNRGAYIIMGGAHPTSYPEEAQLYCDSLFIGFAEQTFPQFLYDYIKGTPEKIYKHDSSQVLHSVIPRRDLLPKGKYLSIPSVIANRGCLNDCEFCSISQNFGKQNVARPIDEVMDEMLSLKSKHFVFLDPSPSSFREYSMELYERLIPLKIKWAGLATSNVYKDPEFMDLMKRSGCIGSFVGFESINQESMNNSRKHCNSVENYKDCIAAYHKRKMDVMGTFILGLDGDTLESLQKMPQIIDDMQVDIPRLAVLTPYPGTATFSRLKEEGRILTENWSYYDSQKVVYQPKGMSPEELQNVFYDVYRKLYSRKRVLKRSWKSQNKILLPLFNIGFRKIVRNIDQFTGFSDKDYTDFAPDTNNFYNYQNEECSHAQKSISR